MDSDFDAALDAAVEAAYDDGYDIADEVGFGSETDEMIIQNRRNVEMAKQKVREAEMEAAVIEGGKQNKKMFQRDREASLDTDYLDEEAEEEERILEEMTRGYGFDEFEFDLQTKSTVPRQSDSSGLSGRTWESSLGSNTANTSLTPSTDSVVSGLKHKSPPVRAPPTSALPPPPAPGGLDNVVQAATPPQASARPPSFAQPSGPGVRERRLSLNAKQLTIETNQRAKAAAVPMDPNLVGTLEDPRTATMLSKTQYQAPPATAPILRAKTSLPRLPVPQPGAAHEANAGSVDATEERSDEGTDDLPDPPRRVLARMTSAPEGIRKNVSSTSLKSRNLLISNADPGDVSPATPSSATFPVTIESRKGVTATAPVMPTPTGASFTVNGLPTGGMYLFDDHIKSPPDGGAEKATTGNAPSPLEACPESFLLRPFWLMRCLYQTIAHPRGGYLTTKLFIPRDVWRVKNVKIKGLDEKIAACDLLTAALQKLAKVDTYDADEVLEEMQSFESVIEQVRLSLAKKLGNEVGVSNAGSLFKGATTVDDSASSDVLTSKTTNASGKSFYSGWRKLRNKSSGAALTSTQSSVSQAGRDTLTLSSLPMTSNLNTRTRKRNMNPGQFSGANSSYMGALARLFDAVQILGKQRDIFRMTLTNVSMQTKLLVKLKTLG